MSPTPPPSGVLFLIFLGLLALLIVPMFIATQRRRRPVGGGPPHGQPQPRAISHVAPAVPPVDMSPAPPRATPIHQRPIEQRKHTALAAISQHGKTTTMLTLAINDLARDATLQAIFLSTHFTLYHEHDQPIDLRPITNHIEYYYTAVAIQRSLVAVNAEIDQRLARYRSNQDVGYPIAVYIGEHGELKEELGVEYLRAVRRIANQGIKCRVYLGCIELHSALVEEMGGGSSFRQKFHTRLAASSVDDKTWAVFTSDAPRTPTPRGWWMSADGLVEVVRPGPDLIAQIAQRPAPTWRPLVETPPENGASSAETFPAPETGISASETEIPVSISGFSAPEIARIGIALAGKKTKTEIVTAMPGYTSRQHAHFAAIYDALKNELQGDLL